MLMPQRKALPRNPIITVAQAWRQDKSTPSLEFARISRQPRLTSLAESRRANQPPNPALQIGAFLTKKDTYEVYFCGFILQKNAPRQDGRGRMRQRFYPQIGRA